MKNFSLICEISPEKYINGYVVDEKHNINIYLGDGRIVVVPYEYNKVAMLDDWMREQMRVIIARYPVGIKNYKKAHPISTFLHTRGIRIDKNLSLRDELEKNMLFLRCEDIINKYASNSMIWDGITPNNLIKTMLSLRNQEIRLNNIHYLSLKDVRILVDNALSLELDDELSLTRKK